MPRLPSSERLIGDIETWLRSAADEELEDLARVDGGAEGAALRARFHPAGEPVDVHVSIGGRVEVDASTAAVGPGYHTWLCHLLRRLGVDAAIDWLTPEMDAATRDDSGYFWSESRPDVERCHLVWLREQLARAADRHDRAGEPFHLGAFGGHRFEADAPLVTALGPRSEPWLAEALDRPSVAIDVWPWHADAQDGRYLLNRARSLLWTEVRWRTPATDGERGTLDRVVRLLRRAFPLEPALPYPWREWRSVLQLAGVGTDPMTERIVREAEAADARDEPLVGYRRRPVAVDHAGWTLTVPGSWAERRTEEEWWGGEGGRSVTLAGVETGEGGEPMPAQAFLDKVASHLGPDALTHRDGRLVGRARIEVADGSGIEVGTLEGYAAVLGRGAAIRIEIHDPGDWEWAVHTWRSLAPLE